MTATLTCCNFFREKLNSMNLLLYMSPIAVLVLLPATLVMEPNVIDATITLAITHRYLVLLILINSIMAYGANLLNFLVTKHTSALTLQVCTLLLLPLPFCFQFVVISNLTFTYFKQLYSMCMTICRS